MSVEHWDPAVDGPLTEPALRRKLEARGYAVSRYVYPPGTRFPPHTLGGSSSTTSRTAPADDGTAR